MQNLPQRKQLRLKDYNYSNNGYYFITICTKDRKQILSKINVNKTNVGAGLRTRPTEKINIINTKIGQTIEKTIKYINKKYKCIYINNYIIMPDHIHMIIENSGGYGAPPLQKIIMEIKSYTNKIFNEQNQKSCEKLWQRNYYEHIIRNEKEYLKTIEYMENNPTRWINNHIL